MLNKSFFRPLLFACLWAIPVVGVWLYLLEPVLLPVFTAMDNWLLRMTFERARPELELINGKAWHIHTKILLEAQADGKLRTWSLEIGNVAQVFMGLPLLWTLLLAIPNYRIRNLLFGSLVVSILIIFALWLRASYTLARFLVEGEGFSVFVSKTIQLHLEPVPVWIPPILEAAYLPFAYVATVIAPVLLSYWLNRAWWKNLKSQP